MALGVGRPKIDSRASTKLVEWVFALLVLVGAIATLVWARIPVNKYGWMGTNDLPYDCDGPATTLIVLAPLGVVMLAALIVSAFGLRRRRLAYFLGLFFATTACIRIGLKSTEVVREQIKNRDACR